MKRFLQKIERLAYPFLISEDDNIPCDKCGARGVGKTIGISGRRVWCKNCTPFYEKYDAKAMQEAFREHYAYLWETRNEK